MNSYPKFLLLLASTLFLPQAHAATPADNWEKHCAGCHGADGKAQTRIGRKAGAKDLTDKANQAKITDDEDFQAGEGRPGERQG